MDAAEMYHAAKDAFIDAHKEISHPHVIALPAFRAERTLADGDTDPAHVVGLRFDSTKNDWVFVCIVEDGSDGIYVSEHDELVGELPAIAGSPT